MYTPFRVAAAAVLVAGRSVRKFYDFQHDDCWSWTLKKLLDNVFFIFFYLMLVDTWVLYLMSSGVSIEKKTERHYTTANCANSSWLAYTWWFSPLWTLLQPHDVLHAIKNQKMTAGVSYFCLPFFFFFFFVWYHFIVVQVETVVVGCTLDGKCNDR